MAKHRQHSPPVAHARSDPRREALVWVPFACALVPLVLVWSGAGWRVALTAGGLLGVVAVLSCVVLVLSGPPRPHVGRNDVRRRP